MNLVECDESEYRGAPLDRCIAIAHDVSNGKSEDIIMEDLKNYISKLENSDQYDYFRIQLYNDGAPPCISAIFGKPLAIRHYRRDLSE